MEASFCDLTCYCSVLYQLLDNEEIRAEDVDDECLILYLLFEHFLIKLLELAIFWNYFMSFEYGKLESMFFINLTYKYSK